METGRPSLGRQCLARQQVRPARGEVWCPQQPPGLVVHGAGQADDRVDARAVLAFGTDGADEVDQSRRHVGMVGRGGRPSEQHGSVRVDQGGPHLGAADVGGQDERRRHQVVTAYDSGASARYLRSWLSLSRPDWEPTSWTTLMAFTGAHASASPAGDP